jgi:hypothetical protein
MSERINTTDVLAKDSVGDVHPETLGERILRKFPFVLQNAAAALIVVAAFITSVAILFSDKPSLADYRTGAWSVISGIAGAGVNQLFGSRRSSRS